MPRPLFPVFWVGEKGLAGPAEVVHLSDFGRIINCKKKISI